ncbi:MAG: type III polyketide synthase [Cyclobacteriaceae bacterium]|nr:type III polyketide synthase [Cyclobacteriaceae bacterium SS2]
MPAYITSIGTAVPAYRASQQEYLDFMLGHLTLTKRKSRELQILYRASGIHYRHSAMADYQFEYDFFPDASSVKPFPSVSSRLEIYNKESIKLCIEAARKCLDQTQIDYSDITHLIVVSCTGMRAPGNDIALIEELGMNPHVERTAVNFMGCYGSFNGLKLANHILGNQPEAKVLLVSVELCTLHLQDLADTDNLLANSLFSDGAAAVLLESTPKRRGYKLENFHCDLSLGAKKEMEWDISESGFLMTLSMNIPDIIRREIKSLTNRLLKKLNINISEIDFFAIHPGGRRILEVIQQELGFPEEKNQYSMNILRNYGNMSSSTVLFVLNDILQHINSTDQDKNVLSFAFGPGLTMESALFKIQAP